MHREVLHVSLNILNRFQDHIYLCGKVISDPFEYLNNTCVMGQSSIHVHMRHEDLDGSYPPYGYTDLPLDTLPLDPDLHDPYIADMTYDQRLAYPEPL
ncbi:hypothetical protein PAMA_009070 [Pampus argenteus]